MENENTILSENDKAVLALKAGASFLETRIENTDDCVTVENTVPTDYPNSNVFKFQHKSGRVYTLTQRVHHVVKNGCNSHRFQIIWGLVTCSMNDTLYNLTNLRRHFWYDWLTDDTVGDERHQYFWFRFHGKRLNTDYCSMYVNVYDDGSVSVTQNYDGDYIVRNLLDDTEHLANRIKQKDLKDDSNYISGNHKRKQMMEVVNSVMAIEGLPECIVKEFNPDVFKLIQNVEQQETVLFDEINTAKVLINVKAVLPAFEDRVAFTFKYKMTVNTQDYTSKCNENQTIELYSMNAKFEVEQVYKSTMPFVVQFDLIPNKITYTKYRWSDSQRLKLCDIGVANPTTGKSFVQEFVDGYLAMKPITDAVKSVC